ncbi:MAG: ATP-grasp domain-containing protein [Streptococcaceae bacterium]|jgi:biotin carboxylase|nr:ATP-grasp domain-containing protein [Streptococcaceae bacterium]
MKNVLIVGGGPEFSNFENNLRNNHEFKFSSISAIPIKYNDLMEESIVIDFRDWGNAISQIKSLKVTFNTVICLDEALIHIADDIAKELGLSPLSQLNSQPFRYKDRMRIICESAGIKTPKYRIINSYKESEKLVNWTYPLIVKPTSFLASIGVKKVHNFRELQAQVNQQLNIKFSLYFDKTYELGELYGLEPRVLVEEFIEGAEYSLESIITETGYQVIGVTKKITHKESFMDEVGHIFPASLSDVELDKIHQWGEKLHR